MTTAIIAFFVAIVAEIILLAVTGLNVGPGEFVIMLVLAIAVAIYANRRANTA